MLLAGKRCRSGSAAAGPINVISCGGKLRAALVLLAGAPCARLNAGIGMRWVIGQDTMGVTVMQDEPCRVMARVSGRAALAAAARGAGTSGRRFR